MANYFQKNMAIVNDNGFLSGHIGEMVFRELNSKQVVQSKPTQYHDANSQAQQKQRSGMRNILAFYRLLKGAVKTQFEEADSLNRPYNRFVHYNLLLPAVDLSKQDYSKRLCIPAPYIVSHGSLPSLEVCSGTNCIQFQMKQEEWKPGDTLRLIKVEHQETTSDIPACLKASFSDESINIVEDKLISSGPLSHGAYAYIHIRDTRKGLLVSTQQLILL